MANPIIEIKMMVESFESKTGIKPNTLFITQGHRDRLNKFIRDRIELITYYPEIFQMTFRFCEYRHGSHVALVSNSYDIS